LLVTTADASIAPYFKSNVRSKQGPCGPPSGGTACGAIIVAMKIDVFCHIMPRSYADRLASHGHSATPPTCACAAPRTRDGRPRPPVPAVGGIRDDYRQVVSLPPRPSRTSPPRGVARVRRLGNEGLAELVRRHPDHFAGFVACLPMNDVDAAVAEIDYAAASWRARSADLHARQGPPMDEPRFEPIYRRWPSSTARLGPPSRNRLGRLPSERRSKYELWWVFGWEYGHRHVHGPARVLRRAGAVPNLKVLVHHGGSMIPHFAGRVGPAGTSSACAPRPTSARTSSTTRSPSARSTTSSSSTRHGDVRRQHAIRCTLDFFGADHVLFASGLALRP